MVFANPAITVPQMKGSRRDCKGEQGGATLQGLQGK